MEWRQLLASFRPSSLPRAATPSKEDRTDFERDWDRIVFSTAFRRLHDKTQVFPLPEDDVVHSRLTHSLEVASVGRSLGTRIGRHVCKRESLPDLSPADFGCIVAAACLAHDIGNPPFGHAGENALQRFFCSNDAAPLLGELSSRERCDLQNFEGNAQGFRVLTRLQFEEYGGLRLTGATLGTFLKYPRESGDDLKDLAGASSKKFGVFQGELPALQELAAALGLPPYLSRHGGRGWKRHPLAYVVEAADDICNALLDLEDGARLGYVEGHELDNVLKQIARAAPNFSEYTYSGYTNTRDRTGYLRALTIGVLVEACTIAFVNKEKDILLGNDVEPLVKLTPYLTTLDQLLRMARDACYRAPAVLEAELAGYSAFEALLSRLIPAAAEQSPPSGSYEERVLQFLERRSLLKKGATVYERILRVVDYVSGMTDRYALAMYRKFSGVALSGPMR